MNGWDFSILWAAGRAVLDGRDPYTVPNFFYPLPLAYALALFALLPERISFGVWIAVNVGLLVISFRKGFWKWLLFVPVLHAFSSGQLELLWWFMERGMGRSWRGAILGALITLKPQTALLLLPWHLIDWLRHDRRMLVRWAGLTGVFWGLPLLWRPHWLSDWMSVVPGLGLQSAGNSPGLFSLVKVSPAFLIPVAVVAVGVFIWGLWQRKEVTRAATMLASPVGLFYSTMALMDCAPAWLLVPVSLLAVVLTLVTSNFIAFTLLPLATVGWHVHQARSNGQAAQQDELDLKTRRQE